MRPDMNASVTAAAIAVLVLAACSSQEPADRVFTNGVVYTADSATPKAEAVAVRHQIDGVWHAAQPRDRATGDGLLGVYKQLAALDRFLHDLSDLATGHPESIRDPRVALAAVRLELAKHAR